MFILWFVDLLSASIIQDSIGQQQQKMRWLFGKQQAKTARNSS